MKNGKNLLSEIGLASHRFSVSVVVKPIEFYILLEFLIQLCWSRTLSGLGQAKMNTTLRQIKQKDKIWGLLIYLSCSFFFSGGQAILQGGTRRTNTIPITAFAWEVPLGAVTDSRRYRERAFETGMRSLHSGRDDTGIGMLATNRTNGVISSAAVMLLHREVEKSHPSFKSM